MRPNAFIRPVAPQDLDGLFALSQQAGPGMTNFPPERTLLQKKIAWSLESFKKDIGMPGQEYYMFVLQPCDSDAILGCCGIFAQAGGEMPFYSYKLARENLVSPEIKLNKVIQVMYLLHDHHCASEIGTLFLHKEAREQRQGELLSRCRFLFMAAFKERFAEKVIAEMRGVIDEKGRSPFWESLGRHFFDMDFAVADLLCAMGRKQFIGDIMPRCPIYVPLLSQEAQAVLGKVNTATKPAQRLLEKEGFTFEGYVDIFDAGATMECRLTQLETLRSSQVVTWQQVPHLQQPKTMLLSNDSLEFRACVAEVEQSANCVLLTAETIDCLQLNAGSKLRLVEFPLKAAKEEE